MDDMEVQSRFFCCRASVREENPSGPSTRVLTLVTSAQSSSLQYGLPSSAQLASKGHVSPAPSTTGHGQLVDLVQGLPTVQTTLVTTSCYRQLSEARHQGPSFDRDAAVEDRVVGLLERLPRDTSTLVPVHRSRSTGEKQKNPSKFYIFNPDDFPNA